MRSRRMVGNVAVLAVAAGVSLAAGELVLRTFVSLPPRRVEPEVRYTPHAVRRFTLLPNQKAYSYGAAVTIDQRGFRTNGGTAGRYGCPVVFALGDSFTFGLGVADEETWPARLERRLKDRIGGGTSVVNGGTISYGVFQELDLLRGPVWPSRRALWCTRSTGTIS